MDATQDSRIPRLNCGRPLDGATTETDVLPVPGDYSICIHCGHIAAYADDLSLRPLTEAEMLDVAGRSDLLEIMYALALTQKSKPTRQ